MPGSTDLTGRQIGDLTVLRRADRVRFGGRYMWSWQVRCVCGREETYPQTRLTRANGVRSCSVCSLPICDICGKPFQRTNPNQRRHEGDCAEEAARRAYRNHYYKKVATVPNFNKNRAKAEMARDPEGVRARHRDANARYRARTKLDPAALEAMKVYQREYKRARRQALRLDPDAYAQWVAARRERYREYNTEWARQHRATMTAEDKAALRARRREWERQRALKDILDLADRLRGRLDK